MPQSINKIRIPEWLWRQNQLCTTPIDNGHYKSEIKGLNGTCQCACANVVTFVFVTLHFIANVQCRRMRPLLGWLFRRRCCRCNCRPVVDVGSTMYKPIGQLSALVGDYLLCSVHLSNIGEIVSPHRQRYNQETQQHRTKEEARSISVDVE